MAEKKYLGRKITSRKFLIPKYKLELGGYSYTKAENKAKC